MDLQRFDGTETQPNAHAFGVKWRLVLHDRSATFLNRDKSRKQPLQTRVNPSLTITAALLIK